MKFSRRRAVSPIIATLLLIAIAVAAGIVVYVYVSSLSGNLTGSGGQQVSQQLQMLAYTFNPSATGAGQVIAISLTNVGSTSITISNVYVDGVSLNEWGTTGAGAYGKYLLAPTTLSGTSPGCYALVPSGTTVQVITSNQALSTTGTTGNCLANNTTNCNAGGGIFCVETDTAGSATAEAETGGSAGVALAAQSSNELLIGAIGAACGTFPGCPATAGTSHTIKIVTATGGVSTFSVTAGRTG
jgi:flagellin-like protein